MRLRHFLDEIYMKFKRTVWENVEVNGERQDVH